eukprot:scaffold13676_cov30-Tisochrysis_lutea.AAC.4
MFALAMSAAILLEWGAPLKCGRQGSTHQSKRTCGHPSSQVLLASQVQTVEVGRTGVIRKRRYQGSRRPNFSSWDPGRFPLVSLPSRTRCRAMATDPLVRPTFAVLQTPARARRCHTRDRPFFQESSTFL